MTYDFPDIKLGLELEIIDYERTDTRFEGSTWSKKYDGSLSSGGIEYVSLPISGENVITQVKGLCAAIKTASGKVDRSCGFHVHADFSNQSYDSLVRLYKVCDAIYPVMTTIFPRRVRSQYCMPFNEDTANMQRVGTYSSMRNYIYSRYHWVNFLAFGCHRTVENRLHPGTTSAKKILTWSEFWAKLCFSVQSGKLKDVKTCSPVPDFHEEVVDKLDLSTSAKPTVSNWCGLYKQSLESLV